MLAVKPKPNCRNRTLFNCIQQPLHHVCSSLSEADHSLKKGPDRRQENPIWLKTRLISNQRTTSKTSILISFMNIQIIWRNISQSNLHNKLNLSWSVHHLDFRSISNTAAKPDIQGNLRVQLPWLWCSLEGIPCPL